MKQLIERLRSAIDEYRGTGAFDAWTQKRMVEDVPQLLDRLEKLEAVAERAYTLKHIVDHLPQQDEHFEDFLRQTSDKLEDALAALEEDK